MLTVSVAASDPDELRALDDWLRGEETLRGRIRLTAQPPRPGHLGSAEEELLVTLASVTQAAALATTVEVWFRRRVTDVTLHLRIDGGPPVTLSADGSFDVGALLKAAVEAAGG